MGLLTAVHVANALEHEDDLQSDRATELQFDTEYLAGLGVVNRIPAWRQACKEYAERNA